MGSPSATELPVPRVRRREKDRYIVLYGVTWDQYAAMRKLFDDRPGIRLAYCEGALEIMSPGRDHEADKTTIARLLEIYAMEREIPLTGIGSWTLRRKKRERGLEPDECYILGDPHKKRPDLAIEVIVTSGFDKLRIYAGLGVPEVWRWHWKNGRFSVHFLAGGRYQERARSELLPELDLEELASFVIRPTQLEAVRAWRDRLRKQS